MGCTHPLKSQHVCIVMLVTSVERFLCLYRAFSQQFESSTNMGSGQSLIMPQRVMCTAIKAWLEPTLFQKEIMQQLSERMSMKVRRNVIHMFKSSCAPWRLPRLFQDKDLLPSRCSSRAPPPGTQLAPFTMRSHGERSSSVQVTALGNPNLLHMISRTIEELTRLFARFDRDCNGYISKVKHLLRLCHVHCCPAGL